MLQDYDLLFNNARQYNEEGSMVYEDANLLEKLFKDRCRDLGIQLPGICSCIHTHTHTLSRL